MDIRTKNRLWEHTQDGHILMYDIDPAVDKTFFGDLEETLCACSCQWFGWLNL